MRLFIWSYGLYTEIYKWLIVFLLHSSLVFVDEYVFFCIIFDWIFVFRTYRETWIGGEMIKEMIWMFSKICHNVGSSHFLSSFFFYICLINAISLCFIRCHIYFWIYWWLLYKIPLYHCRKCFAIFICISSSSIVSINFMCLYFLNTQVFFVFLSIIFVKYVNFKL